MSELDGATTGVGGILAAMIYQIEKTNNDDKQKRDADELDEKEQEFQLTDRPSQNKSNLNVNQSKEQELLQKEDEKMKNELVRALDDIYNELAIEHAVKQTDFSH